MSPAHSRLVAPIQRPHIAPIHRGPGAVSHHNSTGLPQHAPNAALLIDFDNVTMGIRSDLQAELRNLLASDIIKGKVAVQRAYADWQRYPQYIVPLAESSIDMIMAPAYGSSKKNATDIRLAIDALELVFTRPEIGTFILLSGDSDFSSLVIKLKEYGKYVIGVGIRESSSDLLVMNCDEYYSYNALAGLVKSGEEELVKKDPWELVTEAVARMQRNGNVMRADRLKQVMQQIDSSFDEKNLGMPKFSRFVSEAAQRGLIVVTKTENGQYEVAPPQELGVPIPPPTAATLEPGAAVEPRRENGEPRRENGEGRRRGRGRGRRDGRDENRPARPPRDDATAVAAADQPKDSAARPPLASEGASAPVLASTPQADGIGVTGLRLTRDEALDLVRRAVESLVTADASVRGGDVRGAARRLLGRDSESLSERNFERILRDAHDANVIDLRRRGNDYEVSRAAEAKPLADQLKASEPAPKSPPLSAPAPRGMVPRGLSRGRPGTGKGAPPPDLLSIGIVSPVRVSAPPPPPVAEVEAEPVAAPAKEEAPTAGRKRGARKTAGRKTAASALASAAADTDAATAATPAPRTRKPRPKAKTASKS